MNKPNTDLFWKNVSLRGEGKHPNQIILREKMNRLNYYGNPKTRTYCDAEFLEKMK